MVLKDDLFYYEDEPTYQKGKDAKGVIRLDSYFCVKKDGENPDHEFTIFAVPKPLVCHAESREEMEEWVSLLTGEGVGGLLCVGGEGGGRGRGIIISLTQLASR